MMVRMKKSLLRSFASLCLLLCSCGGTGGDGAAPGRDVWDEARASIDRRIAAHLEAGRYEEGIALADSAVASGLNDARILGQMATALGELGRFEESIALFEEAILADYPGCDNHLNFAVMLTRAGKTGRAITEFMVAKRFCDSEKIALINRNLAVVYIKLGTLDRALGFVREGLQKAPTDQYLRGLEGMLIADTDPARAESLFVELVNDREADPEFLYQFGLLLMRTGRFLDAAEMLGVARTKRPENEEIALNLAEALDRAGRDREAEELLRALTGGSYDLDARRKLAGILFEGKRFDEALDLYMALPGTPEIMDRIAMSHYSLGRYDEALGWERKALEARPEWPAALVNLAVIHAVLGELDEARSILERVLELEPDNGTARINLERLESALEKR